MSILEIFFKYRIISFLSGLVFIIIFSIVSLIYVIHKKYQYQVFGRKIVYLLKHGYKFEDIVVPSEGWMRNRATNHVFFIRDIRKINFNKFVEEVKRMEDNFFSVVQKIGWGEMIKRIENYPPPVLVKHDIY